MSVGQHLVLWVHIAFAIFTIGPVTLAIMSTPRYIRRGDIQILRYLSRITFVFTVGSLVVLIAGEVLAQMLHEASKPWLIVAATLFLVAIVLLALIVRDQRHAISALETAAEVRTGGHDLVQAETAEPGTTAAEQGTTAAGPAVGNPARLASVERGRVAMLGGMVSLIWLIILVLMVWNS